MAHVMVCTHGIARVVGLDMGQPVTHPPCTGDKEGTNYIHLQETRLFNHTRLDSKGK